MTSYYETREFFINLTLESSWNVFIQPFHDRGKTWARLYCFHALWAESVEKARHALAFIAFLHYGQNLWKKWYMRSPLLLSCTIGRKCGKGETCTRLYCFLALWAETVEKVIHALAFFAFLHFRQKLWKRWDMHSRLLLSCTMGRKCGKGKTCGCLYCFLSFLHYGQKV